MFKKTVKQIKQEQLEGSFIQKSKKEKFGGKGIGGVYRHKKTGKDYLIKRTRYFDKKAQEEVHWRCWDEILSGSFLKHAGILVPNMFAVVDKDGWTHVASEMIPGVNNCSEMLFKKLPGASKDQVYASLMLHCWLGNRDVINIEGENFVVDSNDRVFHVDLGAALYSGFRSIIGGQDDINFNSNIDPFLLSSEHFGVMTNHKGQKRITENVKSTRNFFAELLDDPIKRKQFYLQGAWKISQFSDQDIEDLVNSSGHTPENKQKRIKVLKERKVTIIQYVQKEYGQHALLEEQMALELQRILHRQGLYKPFAKKGGSDAMVSFRAQYQNALKPDIKINENNTVTILCSNRVNDIQPVFQYLVNKGEHFVVGNQININMPYAQFRAIIQKELIENALQAFFSSFNYTGPGKYKGIYKGDGHKGFRPKIVSDDKSISFALPANCDPQTIKAQVSSVFNIDAVNINIENDILSLSETNLAEFAAHLMENTGVRKTAVVSENEDGQILAGKLELSKKGVSGFATAGGNSEHHFNPLRAAREEGGDEFGYSIQDEAPLIPLGSTLLNKKKNIFLVSPGGTSLFQDQKIGYKEFQDGSIKYYNFSEFRAAYQKDKTKFDRSSVDLYLRHYQREMQKLLDSYGIDNVLVHIGKKPESLGKISFKASLDSSELLGKTIKLNKKIVTLMNELLGKENCSLVKKVSRQSKVGAAADHITRECLEIGEDFNPANLYRVLVNKLKLPVVVQEVDAVENPFEKLRDALIKKVDDYLRWRANKDIDDGRGYKLGFFSKIRHYSQFGQKRAETLKSALQKTEDMKTLIAILQGHLRKDSKLNNHSLDTYLLEEIQANQTLPLKKSFKLAELEERCALRETISQYSM